MATPILKREATEEFLLRSERTFGIADWVNKNISQDAKILIVREPAIYYFDKEVVYEFVYRAMSSYNRKVNNEKGLVDFLKKDGFTHLIYRHNHYEEKDDKDCSEQTIIYYIEKTDLRKKYLNAVYSTRSTGPNNDIREYDLYELRD